MIESVSRSLTRSVACSLLDPDDCFLNIAADYGRIGLLAARRVDDPRLVG